jgi:hypothetical protein
MKSKGKNSVLLTELVVALIRKAGTIQEKDLMSLVWKDVPSEEFDSILSNIIKNKMVKRTYAERGGVYYTYEGEMRSFYSYAIEALKMMDGEELIVLCNTGDAVKVLKDFEDMILKVMSKSLKKEDKK